MIPLRFDPGPDTPLRLVCLGAHCDDLELGAGGLLLRLLAERPVEVRWHVLTSEQERAAEARAGAEHFLAGALSAQVTVGELPPSFLPDHWAAAKGALREVAADFAPHVVLTHRRDDRHQDHALVGDLTWQTFRDAAILAYEIPKFEGDLGQPNLYVPLSEAQAQEKVRAVLQCFPSQSSRTWFDERTFLGLMRLRGVECNAPSGYAEAFHAEKLTL